MEHPVAEAVCNEFDVAGLGDADECDVAAGPGGFLLAGPFAAGMGWWSINLEELGVRD